MEYTVICNPIRNLYQSRIQCSLLPTEPRDTMFSLLQFDGLILLAIVAVMLFAGLVHGTLGLGFPMVATPILATMMDVRSAILVTLLPTMAVNVASIANSRAALASTRPFIPLVGFTLLGSVAGATILAITDPAPFRIVLE